MAKKVSKSKTQTVNIQPSAPKSKRQVAQYDKIFQENLEKLLPLLIKEVWFFENFCGLRRSD